MADTIPGYNVSVVHRSPNQLTAPTLTELGPVYASGLSWGEELSREGEATATTTPETLSEDITDQIVEALDNDSDVPGLELWIRRGSTLVFQGPLVGLQVQGEDVSWSLVARGPLYYLRYMFLRESATLEFDGVDQHTIAETLIDDWQSLDYGNYGLDLSQITASGTTRDRTYAAGDNVYQRVTELGAVDGGFDIWVNADREVMLGTKGSDLTGSVVLDRRGITDAGLAVSFAAGDLASEAYGRNTDDESPLSSEQSDTTLRQSFGRSGVAGSFDGVTAQSTMDDHAQALLDSRTRPLVSPTPQLIPVDGAGVDDFGTGDTVVFAPRIGISGLSLERRVLKKSVTVSDDGTESIGVEFA